MTCPTAPASTAEPFADRLRSQTQAAHTRAESAGFMSTLLDGKSGVDHYVALLSQYHFIYSELERVSDRYRTDPIAGAFIDDALYRRDAIENDLAYFLGASWREQIAPLPATDRYVDRLANTVPGGSALFVAHHYLRYLGDLSGGQIIRVMIQRHYNVDAEALTFLHFPLVPKPRPYKDAYRAALDAAHWSPAERDTFISEVDVAYGLNFDLFTELGESTAPTSGSASS